MLLAIPYNFVVLLVVVDLVVFAVIFAGRHGRQLYSGREDCNRQKSQEHGLWGASAVTMCSYPVNGIHANKIKKIRKPRSERKEVSVPTGPVYDVRRTSYEMK